MPTKLILHSHSLFPRFFHHHTNQNISLWLSLISAIASMAPDLERPRITEIKVRMDCNGCVQKIKKALHGINGIYDLYIDFPQQKLTIVGWADPEKIVKAIRKTRKIAVICSHTEQPEPSDQQSTEPTPDSGDEPPPPAPADGENPPPPEEQQDEAAQQGEPPNDQPPPENPVPPENPQPPPTPEDQPPEVKPTPIAADTNAHHAAAGPSGSKDVGEVHVIHHHPPDYGHRPPDYGYRYGYPPPSYPPNWNYRHPSEQVIRHEIPQVQPQSYTVKWYNGHPNEQVIRHEAPKVQPQSYPGHWNNRPPSEQVIQHEAPQAQPQRHRESWNSRYPNEQVIHQEAPQPQPQPQRYSENQNSTYLHEQVIQHELPQAQPQREWNNRHPSGQRIRHEAPQVQPVYVTHSYNTYNPSPYVTEYEYVRSPPRYTSYSRMDHYNEDYHNSNTSYYSNSYGNGNFTSMFSDENPNACRIM